MLEDWYILQIWVYPNPLDLSAYNKFMFNSKRDATACRHGYQKLKVERHKKKNKVYTLNKWKPSPENALYFQAKQTVELKTFFQKPQASLF